MNAAIDTVARATAARVAEPAAAVAGVAAAAAMAAADPPAWLERLPFPGLAEDGLGRILHVNTALCRLLGWSSQQLIGRRPTELMADGDRPLQEHAHERARSVAGQGLEVAPRDCRLVGADGREHDCRVWLQPGGPGLVWLMQEISEEHRLRSHADRVQDELTQWFDLSPVGNIVFDEAGLILRANRVFEGWLGDTPVTLADAPLALQQLLGWSERGLRGDLRPGQPVIDSVVDCDDPSLPVQRLQARLRAYEADDGSCRVMAVVQDCSAEVERERMQLQQAALVTAAGVHVVRVQELAPQGMAALDAEGALEPARRLRDAQLVGLDTDGAALAALERLRRAMRSGQSTEVRYGVVDPEQGPRWMLTRLQPARLRSGRSTTTVVTLDVTDQERGRQQREELLRELTTILDGSPVGIAYLREGRLVRCNLRFERMLGFAPGAAAGVAVLELFELRGLGSPGVETTLQALASGRPCDVEMSLPELHPDGRPSGELCWYALSLRRAEPVHAAAEAEAVAVLTDITRLKRQQSEIERALHERELMFNQSDVGIAWLRDGHIVRANAAMSEMTGLSPMDLTGRHLTSLYAAGDAGIVDEEMRVWLAVRGRHVSEHRLRQRDGGFRWTQVSVRAVDASDLRSDLICAFVDVDERQRARESLQQLAGRTRAVLDSVLVGIVTVGEHGIEWMNRSARRMFGGELGDFMGESIGCVASPEPGHPLNRTDWLERLADGESENFECRLKARDGREFWVVGNAVATPRDSAVGRQITFALLDIEARRQAEVKISGARASLQRLIETAPLAIALFDARALQVIECNQGGEAFFGRPTAQLLGRGPEDCLDDREAGAALRASLVLARDTAEGVRREISRPGAAGQPAQRWDTRFVHLGAPVAAGAAAGSGQVLLVANDVTELRVAEQARLEAAIAQREMLVKEVHHRIKNNLQGVAGLLQQTAQRRPEVGAELMEAIGQVQAIAQVYGLQVGADGPLDLLGVLRAIAGTVQRSLGHVIDVGLDGEQPLRWMLPESESIPLALSLNELLNNAVRHGDHTPVRCQVHARADDVQIEISNGGQLPAGFELRLMPAGMHGLGLVRALLPRRAASLELLVSDGRVRTLLTLRPPSVRPAPRSP